MRGNTLAKIDAIRGLAALFVALSHTAGFILIADYALPIYGLSSRRELAAKLLVSAFSGQAAVVVLFLISGFVIGRSLDRLNATALSRDVYLGFLFRRLARLYPAHAAAVLAIALAGWLFLGFGPAIDFQAYPPLQDGQSPDWLNGLVFSPPKLRSILGNLAVASWSLNLVAWSVYVQLAAAPLLPMFHGLSRTNRGWVDIAAVAGLVLFASALGNPLWLSYWFVFHLGMLVETRGRDWAGFVRARLGAPGAVIAVSYVAMLIPALICGYHNRQSYVAVEAVGGFSFLSLIVWCGYEVPSLAVLDRPALGWLGRVSYSFYLWHYFVLTVMVRQVLLRTQPAALQAEEWWVFAAVFLASTAVALAAAQISRCWIELPALALARKLLERWRGQGTVVGLAPGLQHLEAGVRELETQRRAA
jgi:peptidoglycan/LPS O-acetylase OafA/YrhL